MAIFKEKRFDLRWLGEIKEDGTEIYGHTVASSKTVSGLAQCRISQTLNQSTQAHSGILPTCC